MDTLEKQLRQNIAEDIKKIYTLRKKNKKFIPGKTWIQYGGGVFDHLEINASIDSLLSDWFGLGRKAKELEDKLSNFIGTKGCILTNSGSSANFLAIASVKSTLFKNHLEEGEEIITAACGFPTTINPIIQHGFIPVFLDVNPNTYNLNAKDLKKALSPKTKAIFIAHTLGNPNEMDEIVKFCKYNNLYLLEDNCDAFGSEYDGKKTGSFGILSTQSFYPPHHITMGEGGAIFYQDGEFEKITRSLRDWGRMCWCRGDEKRVCDICKQRADFKIDGKDYDPKYAFDQMGYNLKPLEHQAAMGLEQFKRVPEFIKARERNFKRLFNYSKQWEEYFILPKSVDKANPCWFAFPLTIRDNINFTRAEIIAYLEQRMIEARPIFAGNLTRQPAYKNVKYRKIGDLVNSDRIMFNAFFIGIYQGIGDKEIDYMAGCINDFLRVKTGKLCIL